MTTLVLMVLRETKVVIFILKFYADGNVQTPAKKPITKTMIKSQIGIFLPAF